ncbi:uncharacterized protein SETTUDRAFT_168679, partial [Exserohilum turcica Et28A]
MYPSLSRLNLVLLLLSPSLYVIRPVLLISRIPSLTVPSARLSSAQPCTLLVSPRVSPRLVLGSGRVGIFGSEAMMMMMRSRLAKY